MTDRGQVIAEANADETGQFVMLPPAFAPGAHALGLSAHVGDGVPIQSPGIVGIDVPPPPAKPASGPMIASAAAIPAAKLSLPLAPTPPVKAPTPLAKSPAQPNPAAPAPAKPVELSVVAKSDASVPAGAATPRTAITGVAADEAGRLVATGAAAPGAFLRLYLNGSFLASVTAGKDGLWSLIVEHGMRGGAYAIRADEIDRTKDAVISRAEVPFNYPEHVAEQTARAKPAAPPAAVAQSPASVMGPQKTAAAPPPAARAEAAPPAVAAKDAAAAASPNAPPAPVLSAKESPPASEQGERPVPSGAAQAIVRLVDTAKVVHGDSLWAISAHLYGNGLRYTQIYAANATQIRNPRLIYPGQIFVLPQSTPF